MNQVATADIDSNQDSPPKHGTIGDSSLQFLYQNHDTNVFFPSGNRLRTSGS